MERRATIEYHLLTGVCVWYVCVCVILKSAYLWYASTGEGPQVWTLTKFGYGAPHLWLEHSQKFASELNKQISKIFV